MISISEIRNEIEKILDKDFLKSEYKKIKKEVQSMDFYKKIPAPTLKHISQLEDQFTSLSKKLSHQQKWVDQEISNAIQALEKRKDEATSKIKHIRDYAFEQKEFIEDIIREKLEKLAGEDEAPVQAAKKAKASVKKAVKKKVSAQKAAAKKKAKKVTKAVRKTKAKSKAVRKTKAKAKAKSKVARKTKAKSRTAKKTTASSRKKKTTTRSRKARK